MARARNRDAVLKALRKALDEDRTKTFVVEISPLGLVEMTRQNVTDGVREIMTKTCPMCGGEGVVKSEETIAIEVERQLRELVAERGADGPEAFLVRLNPRVTAYFTADGARMLHALEEETGRYFHFEGSEGLPLDHFAITAEGTRAEIEERAVPFREGEEVHVDIVEPHMYSEDDAVAKVDGYLIEVTDGDPVRGREEARADRAGRPHGGARRARRRGRRGGRGRHRGAARGPRARGQARGERRADAQRRKAAEAAAPAPASEEAEAIEALARDRTAAGTGRPRPRRPTRTRRSPGRPALAGKARPRGAVEPRERRRRRRGRARRRSGRRAEASATRRPPAGETD